jgi:hypothetical protein
LRLLGRVARTLTPEANILPILENLTRSWQGELTFVVRGDEGLSEEKPHTENQHDGSDDSLGS